MQEKSWAWLRLGTEVVWGALVTFVANGPSKLKKFIQAYGYISWFSTRVLFWNPPSFFIEKMSLIKISSISDCMTTAASSNSTNLRVNLFSTSAPGMAVGAAWLWSPCLLMGWANPAQICKPGRASDDNFTVRSLPERHNAISSQRGAIVRMQI